MRWWWPFSRGGGRRRASASASTSNNGYDLTPPGSADSLATFGIADSSVAAVEAKLAFLKKCKLIVDVLADGTVGDLEAELRHMATHMRAVEMPEGRVFADTRKFMDLQSLYLVVGGVVEVFAPDENNGDAVTLIGVVVQGQVVGLLRELYQLPAGAYAKVKHGEAIPPSLVRPITEVSAWLKSAAAAEVQKEAATSRWGGWMAKVFRRRRGRDDVDSSTGATGATGTPLAIAPTEEAVSNLRGELNDAPTRGNAVLYEIPPSLLERSRLSEKLRARQVTLEDLLSFVPLLKSLTEAQRRLLCDCFERVVVPPDKAISSKAADSDDDGDDDLSDDEDGDDGDIMDAIDELASSRGGSTTRRSGSRKTNATNLFDEEVRPRREQRAALAAVAADRRHYRRWRGLVVRQGEDGDAFYVVVSGRLVALLETDAGAVDAAAIGDVLDDEGRVVPRSFGFEVAQYSRGGYFGELALLTGEPRKATVKNASGDEPAVLMRCTAADFERKILCMPGVRNALEATMASVAAFNRMRAEERNREDEMMKRKHIEDVINMTGSPMIGQSPSPSPSPSPTKRFGEGLSPAITERTGMATPSSAASPHSMGTLLTPALSGRPSYMRRVAPDTEELRGLDELRPPKGEQRIKKLVSILQCTLALEGLKVHEVRRVVRQELVLSLLRPGEVLFTEDDPGHAMFIVEAGTLVVRRHATANPNLHGTVGAYSPPGSRHVSPKKTVRLRRGTLAQSVSHRSGQSSPMDTTRRTWAMKSPLPNLPGTADSDDGMSAVATQRMGMTGRGGTTMREQRLLLDWGAGREGDLEDGDEYQHFIHGSSTYSLGPCDVLGDCQVTFDIPFRSTAAAGENGCKLWMLSRRAVEMANGGRDQRGKVIDRTFLGSGCFSGELPLVNQFVDRVEMHARWIGARFRKNDPKDSWLGNDDRLKHILFDNDLMFEGSLFQKSMWRSGPLQMRLRPGFISNFFFPEDLQSRQVFAIEGRLVDRRSSIPMMMMPQS